MFFLNTNLFRLTLRPTSPPPTTAATTTSVTTTTAITTTLSAREAIRQHVS